MKSTIAIFMIATAMMAVEAVAANPDPKDDPNNRQTTQPGSKLEAGATQEGCDNDYCSRYTSKGNFPNNNMEPNGSRQTTPDHTDPAAIAQ